MNMKTLKLVPSCAILFCAATLVGCGSSTNSDRADSVEAKISETTKAIEYWKQMQDSGEWQQNVEEGVAVDLIEDKKYQNKPSKYPAAKIAELESELEQLRAQNAGTD